MDRIGKHRKDDVLFLKALGSRIFCELNDLKRTPEIAAKELNISLEDLETILKGISTEKKAYELINKMGNRYPIDCSQMFLLKDDTTNGIKFMSAEVSKKTSRIYNRKDKDNNFTPYYEYRDTVMSSMASFKPERISILRTVNDCDPNNPDVILNNGHFMHQITLFVGPINFYYEDIIGNIHCHEMNTGDCNYITPFMKHSFASRSEGESTYIIACTIGGNVSGAQKELYALGHDILKNYSLDFRENRAAIQLIEQQMKNNMLSVDNIDSLLKESGSEVNIKEIFKFNKKISLQEYKDIAAVLDLEISDIMMPKYKLEEECMIKYISENRAHHYPNNEKKLYNIYRLSNTSKMPQLRSSIIDIECEKPNMNYYMQKSLHTYMINFGDCPVEFMWEYDHKIYQKVIELNDSVYLKPFIKFSYGNSCKKNARMLVVGTSSTISLQTQKELSTFIDPSRTIKELEPWYDY